MADINESNLTEGVNESTAGDGDLHRKANRVIAFLSQITESLEETEMAEMNEILLGIFEVSKQNDSAQTSERLMDLYSRFFEIVEFHSGISVTLIDQALRSFKMIAMDAMNLGKLVSEKYMEIILLEYPSLGIDMKLTTELLSTYFRLLKEGYEEVCHIRLMVVGMYGVGKSTLVKRLCNQPIDHVTSTVGIDILTNSCEINDDGDWKISEKSQKDRFFQERLQVLVNKYGKRKNTSTGVPTILPTEESGPGTVPGPGQPESFDDEEEKKFAQHVIKKNRENDDNSFSIVPNLIEAEKETKIPRRKPTVSIWDFAGQSVYYSTHHFFLNDRSIYLVVLNLSKKLSDTVDEKDCMGIGLGENLLIQKNTEYLTCHDAFKFWMRSIYIYTVQKENKRNSTYKPTIILIGTHKDKLTDGILGGKSVDQYKEDYFMEALECFKGRPVLNLVHKKKFLVEKDGKYDDFLDIKMEVYHVARQSSFWKEKVPASFILLEKAVQARKDLKEHVMSFESLEKANEDSDLPRPEIKEIELFLKFQNAFGNVLHYNHDQLRKMIILNPQWIIDIFKIFVSHKKDKIPMDLEKWTHFKCYGKLDDTLINELVTGKDLSHAKKDAVLRYMEYLNVMVRPVDISNGDRTSDCMSEERTAVRFFQQYCSYKQTVTGFYIMPCMLPRRPPDNELKELFTYSGIEQPTTLCMYIKKGFLPPFIFHCIIATCIKELPISKHKDQRLLFSCLAEFKLGSTTTLLIWFEDDFLNFTVIPRDGKESFEKKVEYCKGVKKCFEKLVLSVFNIHGKDTFDDRNKSELFEYLVECPVCSQHVPFQRTKQSTNYMNGLLRVANFDTTNSMSCSNCREVVTKQQALGYWFDIEHKKEGPLSCKPAEDMLADFAESIGDEIDRLRCELLIDDPTFSNIRHDYKDHRKTMIFHVLHLWKQRGESLQILYNAMAKSGCGLENFYRIVAREETEETKKTIRSCMEGLDETEFDTNEDKWRRVVADLKDCIGLEYWLLGIRLGIRETNLEQRKGDSVAEQIRNVLNKWRKLNKSLEDLVKAMVKSKCDMERVNEVLIQFYSCKTVDM